MGRILLCLQPFSGTARAPCQSLSDADAGAFCFSLSEDLKNLEESLEANSISLRWSVEAMAFLKRMHVQLLALLKKSDIPVEFGVEEDWFDQYMKETTMVLDLCNALKSAVCEIRRYRMTIDLATRVYEYPDRDMELEKLEPEESRDGFKRRQMLNMDDNFCSWKLCDKGSMATVMNAAKTTAAVISLLLSSAFTSSSSLIISSYEQVLQEAHLPEAFTASLSSLASRFSEKIHQFSNATSSPAIVLAEHEMVQEVVGDVKSQMAEGEVEDREKFSGCIELLRQRSMDLQEGIELFDAVVDEVFDVVIRGRNEMLGALSDNG